MKLTIIVVVILLIAVIGLVIGYVPLMEVPYTETIEYQDTETYNETVPLEHELIVNIRPSGVGLSAHLYGYIIPRATITVWNKDTIEGNFSVIFRFVRQPYTGDKTVSEETWTQFELDKVKEFTVERILTLKPNEQKDAIFAPFIDYSGDTWTWEYEVIADTKTVEKERTVTKERTETQYKKVSILEYLFKS